MQKSMQIQVSGITLSKCKSYFLKLINEIFYIIYNEFILGEILRLEQMKKECNDCVQKFSNRIEHSLNKTEWSMRENERLYKFLLTNPLRHFIPEERKYKNRSYKEYESVFMVRYRMLSSDNTLPVTKKKHWDMMNDE